MKNIIGIAVVVVLVIVVAFSMKTTKDMDPSSIAAQDSTLLDYSVGEVRGMLIEAMADTTLRFAPAGTEEWFGQLVAVRAHLTNIFLSLREVGDAGWQNVGLDSAAVLRAQRTITVRTCREYKKFFALPASRKAMTGTWVPIPVESGCGPAWTDNDVAVDITGMLADVNLRPKDIGTTLTFLKGKLTPGSLAADGLEE